MIHRFTLVTLLLAAITLVACNEDDIIVEPGAPTAHGILTLDEAVDPLQWTYIEYRFAATDLLESGDPGDGEGYIELDDLAEVAFPHEFWVGGGFGTSPYSQWRLIAWLSNEDYEADRTFWDEIPDDRPFDEVIVDIGDCSNGCGPVEVDLNLAL